MQVAPKRHVSPWTGLRCRGSAGRPAHLAEAHQPLCKPPCSVPMEQIREEGGGLGGSQLLSWSHHPLGGVTPPSAQPSDLGLQQACLSSHASPWFTTPRCKNGHTFTQLFSLSPFDRDSVSRPWCSLSREAPNLGRMWECRKSSGEEHEGRESGGSLQKRRLGDSQQAPAFPTSS